MKSNQIMFIELMIAAIIFALAIKMYYSYGPSENDGSASISELARESRHIANMLLTPGYPTGWSATDEERIGIVDESNRINQTKLAQLANMSYEEAHFLLGASYDYIISIADKNGETLNIPGTTGNSIGKPGVAESDVLEDRTVTGAIQTERIVVYQGDVARVRVLVWDGEI